MSWHPEYIIAVEDEMTTHILAYLRTCHRSGGQVSFNDCLSEARKQFAKEVREAALKEQP